VLTMPCGKHHISLQDGISVSGHICIYVLPSTASTAIITSASTL
jgi:hypothetical protein